MKAPAPGSKEDDVRRLRLKRADKTGVVKTPKPNNAPVSASAQPKEKTMKTAVSKKTKTTKQKLRSVSEASANLKAAKKTARKPAAPKTSAKAKTSAATNARTKVEGATAGVRPGSKLEIVANLLKRPEGCTTADAIAGTGWPTLSFPQQAKAAGLVLRKEKEGKVTRYWGTTAKA